MLDKNESVLYTVKDLQRIFGMSKTSAYQLMNSKNFPSFHLNRKVYVSKEQLDKWITSHTGKTLSY